MLTISEIQKQAQNYANEYTDGRDGIEVAYLRGATWANDQCAARIAELESGNEILRNEQTGLRQSVSNLKIVAVNLEADKIELEAALRKWIEAFETQWPIGSVPVYEATKDVLK